MQGQEVLVKQISGAHSYVDVQSLPVGTYIARIMLSNMVVQEKFIKK